MPAAPAANISDAFNKTFRNIIGVGGLNYAPRLQTWKDEFFDALNRSNPVEGLIYRWIVPTNRLLLDIPPGNPVGGYTAQYSIAMPLAQLVQQTIYAARFNGFVPPAALDAALTAAFNNSWT